MPIPFSFASMEGHLSRPPAEQCCRASSMAGRPPWHPFCLISNMSLSLLVITVAFWFLKSLFKRLMSSCSIPQVLRASQIELWLMESNAFKKSIVANHILTPHSWHFLFNHSVSLNDPSLGRSAGTLPDLRLEFDQVWNTVCCTRSSKTVCTALAKYKSGDSFRRLLTPVDPTVNRNYPVYLKKKQKMSNDGRLGAATCFALVVTT